MSPFSANFRLPGNRKARAARARLAGRTGITLSVVLVATLMPAQAWAAPPGDRSGVELPGLQKDLKVKPDPAAMDALGRWVGDPPKTLEGYAPTAVAPPAAASDSVPLSSVPAAEFVQVGSLPVSIGKVSGTGVAPSGTWGRLSRAARRPKPPVSMAPSSRSRRPLTR